MVSIIFVFIQGWIKSCSNSILAFVLHRRQDIIKPLHSSDAFLVKMTTALMMSLFSSHGTHPQTMVYSKTTRDQTAAEAPWYRPNMIHSGGEKARVPGVNT